MIRKKAGPARGRGYYTRYLTHYAKKNYALLALGLLFICGAVLGTLLLRSAGYDTVSLLLRVVNGFIERRRGQTLLQNFTAGAFSSLLFVLILFVCGFCAVAQPVILLVPLFRGLGYGFSAATLYATYHARAAGFVALFILPNMLLSTLAILVCCRESLRLSGSLFAVMRGDGQARELYSVRLYVARFVVAALLCVLSALLEAVLYGMFANSLLLQ